MNIIRLLLSLSAAALLVGCGDGGRSDGKVSVPDTPENRAIAEKIRQQNEDRDKATQARDLAKLRDASLPTGDQATPLERYTEMRSESQLMQIYYALSGLPVPWERLAEAVSNDFRSTRDSFERQEIMKVLKPKLEREIAGYTENRYVMIPVRVSLNAYDFERGGFPMRGFEADSYLSFGNRNYVVAYTNADQFSFAGITDESVAREIEGVRAKNPHGAYRARVYTFARDAGDESGRYTVKAQIVKVVVEKPDGSVWFEY
jgi:hypothetical protein